MPKQNRPTETASNDNIPLRTFRHRQLKASVWRNPTENGPMYNVTVVRSYRDPKTTEWRDSHSFWYDDLMNVAALMSEARAYISALKAKDASLAKDKPPGRPGTKAVRPSTTVKEPQDGIPF